MRALLLSLALAGALYSQDQPLPDGASLEIVIQEVQGEVDVQTSPKEKWGAARPGARIPVGSKICTGVGSSAAVSFGTNSVAIISECTVCDIQAFEVRGEELVARILLDPGVARVNVRQLAQFHTDFQVSTPRLTCSVRGSEALVVANGDTVADVGVNHAGDVRVDDRALSPGERTNSNGASNYELALRENVANTTPEGATERETADENLLAANAGNIDLNLSDSTLGLSPAPSGGGGRAGDSAPQETATQRGSGAGDQNDHRRR